LVAGGWRKWYKHGQLHRDNDLPAVASADGACRVWYCHGKKHRFNGPAVIWDGTEQWYVNNKLVTPQLAMQSGLKGRQKRRRLGY
jgi:hypothetical protein